MLSRMPIPWRIWAGVLFLALITRTPAAGQSKQEPIVRATVLGTKYPVREQFQETILEKTLTLRRQIRSHREQGKLIGYISIPLTARGGGWYPTNVAVSANIKDRLEKQFGADHFWFLSPGQAEIAIPPIDGQRPSGGEYLYFWTEVLAGEDGLGADFDLVYFAGPTDFASFFTTEGSLATKINAYLDTLQASDPEFAAELKSKPQRRRDFLRYYATRASAAFSLGSHDEWNIVARINNSRKLEDQIGVQFDGRALTPLEMQSLVRPGYQEP
jgi:hypothetical protein